MTPAQRDRIVRAAMAWYRQCQDELITEKDIGFRFEWTTKDISLFKACAAARRREHERGK